MEKQKETVEMMGGTFNPGGLIPSFAEIFLGPVLLLVIGVLAFLGTKKIVEFIIGKDQIKSLLQADRKESQIQSR